MPQKTISRVGRYVIKTYHGEKVRAYVPPPLPPDPAVRLDGLQLLEGLGRPAASVLRVFQHMQRNPIVGIPATARKVGMSAPTVAKSVDHMRKLGILKEVTGRERHRLFVYEKYLAILNEGTEPIR